MIEISDEEWIPRARDLADSLREAGKLVSTAWWDAVRAVPRHVFVPEVLRSGPGGWSVMSTADDAGRKVWLDRVYSNTALSVAPATISGRTVPRSSSSMPGLMTRMLESLDVAPGMTVLEIGTGTGYNAALLSHRLGDAQVTSIDVEADLVERARRRLDIHGYHPTLRVGDGAFGVPDRAPFDRVIATCAVPSVPWPWVEQTRTGGVILTDLKTSARSGSLVRLVRDGDGAEGRFDPTYAAFMSLRHRPASEQPGRVRPPTFTSGRPGRTRVDPRTPWDSLVAWFVAGFDIGPVTSLGYVGKPEDDVLTATRIVAADGSWAEIELERGDDGLFAVLEGGPRGVWNQVETAVLRWEEAGRPGWERFGLTVRAGQQRVWLDQPDGPVQWPVPPPL